MSFTRDTVERTVRTLLQVVAAAVLVYIQDKGWDDIDWVVVLKTAGTAAFLAVVTALAAKRSGSSDSASFQE